MNDINRTAGAFEAHTLNLDPHPYDGYRANTIMRESREYGLEPNLERARAFLQIFGDDVVLCHKDPDAGGMSGLRGADALDRAIEQNSRYHSVYFVPNIVQPGVVKKPAKTDITAIQSVYADLDWDKNAYHGRFQEGLAAIEAKLQTLMDMDAPPSLITLTGGGLQPTWLIEPFAATPDIVLRAEALGHEIAQQFGGDAVQNIDRILRVPWLINHPSAAKRAAGQTPQLATVIYSRPRHRYTLEYLEQAWGVAAAKVVHIRTGRPLPQGGQSELLKDQPFESLGEGIGGGWFDKLGDDDKDTALKQMFDVIPDIAIGGRGEWLNCLMAAQASGAPHAEDIARDWSKIGGDKYSDPDFDKAWDSFTDRPGGITVGTLIRLASERGINPTTAKAFDANEWRAYADRAQSNAQAGASQSDAQAGASHSSTSSGVAATPKSSLPRAPFIGGVYPHQLALAMMNANYAVVKLNVSGEVAVVHHGDGPPVIMREQDAKLELSNVYIKTITQEDKGVDQDSTQLIYRWWKGNKKRNRTRVEVFDPQRPLGVACGPDEFNFWQGFAVKPVEGTDKIQRLLDHILKIICKGDIVKWGYLMMWLAWVVQNPDKHPEVAVVLQSIKEGPGKTLLGELMVRIFGEHGYIINDADQLFGSFTGHLEFTCFALLEEALLAGDPRINDKIKQRLTGNYVPINPKGRQARKVPNRMAAMLCTQHVWAVPAGAGARRWFVLAVSEERIGDKAYFKAIYDDLASGGDGQFLNLLLRVDLKGWHPRHPPKTLELAQQQLMSLPPVYRWLWECASSRRILCGSTPGLTLNNQGHPASPGQDVEATKLRDAFNGWAKEHGHRTENEIVIGRMLTPVLGPKKRLGTRDDRTYCYSVPDGDELKRRISIAQKIDAPADRIEEL